MDFSWLAVSADVVNWRLIRSATVASVLYSGVLSVSGPAEGPAAAWISACAPFVDEVSQFVPHIRSFAHSLIEQGSSQPGELVEHLLSVNLIITLTSLFGTYAAAIWRQKSRPLTLLKRRWEMTAKYEAVSSYFLFLCLVSVFPFLPTMLLSSATYSGAHAIIIQLFENHLGLGIWCVLSNICAGCAYFHLARTLVWFALWVLGLFSTRTYAVLWR